MRIDEKLFNRIAGGILKSMKITDKHTYTPDEVGEVVYHIFNEYNIQVIKEYEEFMSRKEKDSYSLSEL